MVSSTEGSHVAESVESQGVKSMGSKCANDTKCQFQALEVLDKQVVNDQTNFDMSIDLRADSSAGEGNTCDEIVAKEACVPATQECVQGRPPQSLAFWKDVLQAPPPIIECIEKGYYLPLKFLAPLHS